jgi:hypothetical protein
MMKTMTVMMEWSAAAFAVYAALVLAMPVEAVAAFA